MKQFKLLFAVLIAAVCLGSCKKDGGGEEELCAHNKLGVENFVDAMEKESAPQILDYRSAEEYAKGHIPGAISMPVATANLVKDSEYFQNVKKQFSTTKKIFIYGGSDSWGVNGNVLPGIIACDWGKNNTILLDGGFDAWVKAGYPTE